MPDSNFAPTFNRTEEGWITFPTDRKERKSMFFPEAVMAHPAKMNFHLQQSIIEYVTQPGDTLMDIFGGTGTMMIAALQGYRVILIEIEDGYHKLQIEAKENLEIQSPGCGDLVTLLHGDNRLILPIPCNHIITSPPYCLAPGTPVLTSGLSWVPIGSINIGDTLVGIDEYGGIGKGNRRTLQFCVVTGKNEVVTTPYMIELEDGRTIIASGNHRWLAYHKGYPPQWIETSQLTTKCQIRGLNKQVWREKLDWDGGYISGLYDGEGWVSRQFGDNRIGFKQKVGDISEYVKNTLIAEGFTVHEELYRDMVTLAIYGIDECMRLLGSYRPQRLLPQFMRLLSGKEPGQGQKVKVVGIQKLDKPQLLIDLETTTGTYIANGLVSHNSSAMKITKVRKQREDAPDTWLADQDRMMLEYSRSARNISKLNPFLYNMEMDKIYRLCYQSLPINGTLTTVVKDRIISGKRVYLGKWAAKVCEALGMELVTWEKWKTPGHGFTNIARSQGKQVVDEEDILIYRRVET